MIIICKKKYLSNKNIYFRPSRCIMVLENDLRLIETGEVYLETSDRYLIKHSANMCIFTFKIVVKNYAHQSIQYSLIF